MNKTIPPPQWPVGHRKSWEMENKDTEPPHIYIYAHIYMHGQAYGHVPFLLRVLSAAPPRIPRACVAVESAQHRPIGDRTTARAIAAFMCVRITEFGATYVRILRRGTALGSSRSRIHTELTATHGTPELRAGQPATAECFPGQVLQRIRSCACGSSAFQEHRPISRDCNGLLNRVACHDVMIMNLNSLTTSMYAYMNTYHPVVV